MSPPISSIRNLAAVVRGRRQTLGLSQAEVARAASVSRQWVSEIEAGKPAAEIGLVIRLLDALGLAMSVQPRATDEKDPAPTSRVVNLDELLDDYRAP